MEYIFKTNEALELHVHGKRFILSKDKGFSLSPWDLHPNPPYF